MIQWFTVLATFCSVSAHALDLDWHGQFRAETNWLYGYSHGAVGQPNATTDNGYFIPNNGESPGSFQNLFFRLNPDVLVNDNVTIHSEFWLGAPDSSFFGSNASSQFSDRQYTSSQTGNAVISARRFWADIVTDYGLFSVGRAPLHWGMGLVWNQGNGDFDRFPSSGDTVRFMTKFGSFRFIPAFTKYRIGTNLGGSLDPTSGTTVSGSSGMSDYSLQLTYDNIDEQLELGVMFLRRLAGQNQGAATGALNPLGTTTGEVAGMNYNIWDFYFKKSVGYVDFSVEAPLTSGKIGGTQYSSVAFAGEMKARLGDRWMTKIRAGQADGQENVPAGGASSKITLFSFHPDYRPGFLMFNYNPRAFSNSVGGTGLSPYDSPVTNARFLNFEGSYSVTKWEYKTMFTIAQAISTASDEGGSLYYNSWTRQMETVAAGAKKQSSSMGFEVDTGVGYQWDEATRLNFMTGLYFPGAFYKFSNNADGSENSLKTVWGTNFQLSVKF